MKFGPTPVAEAEGAILAHATNLPTSRFKKGRLLSKEDVDALTSAGIESVIVARLEADDVHEDAAAQRIADVLSGAAETLSNMKTGAPFTGRVNISSDTAGVFRVDAGLVNALNRIDPAITLATLPDYAAVEPGQIIATLKIIPFAVPESAVREAEAILSHPGNPAFTLKPYQSKRYAVVQTVLPSVKPSVLDKTAAVTEARVHRLGGSFAIPERRCDHAPDALKNALESAVSDEAEIIICIGASAITDARDVIPSAIEEAGGEIRYFGMPVDPGNLMLLGSIGATTVIGAPGCARSPKLNGVDWVMERIAADIPVGPADIAGMGVGGLLKDIPSRPLPRAEAVAAKSTRPRIAALLLAAGQSRRMGAQNKLLLDLDGKPMVAHVAEAITNSRVDFRIAVTGHEAERVSKTITPFGFDEIVENSAHAQGLSGSLKRGIEALPDDIDAAVVCLGDMPDLKATEIEKLIAAFDPSEGRTICVPTFRGKRGNPVLFARRFFAEITDVDGDTGAKHLIGANQESVVEVEMETDAILKDVDTPEAYAALTHQAQGVEK